MAKPDLSSRLNESVTGGSDVDLDCMLHWKKHAWLQLYSAKRSISVTCWTERFSEEHFICFRPERCLYTYQEDSFTRRGHFNIVNAL